MEETKHLSTFFMKTRTIAGALLLILVVGVGYYFYDHSRQDAQRAVQEEANRLVASVGRLMVLPTGEQPIIATVADPSKLTNQPFFSNAKKGDKVLIYNGARKAVLYRPDEDLIIDVAPLSIGQAPAASNTPAQ